MRILKTKFILLFLLFNYGFSLAQADEPCKPEPDPDGLKMGTLNRWRSSGNEAFPEIIEATCYLGPLNDVAIYYLQELGVAALEPLLVAVRQVSCRSEIVSYDRALENFNVRIAVGGFLCSLEEQEIENPLGCERVQPKRTPQDQEVAISTLGSWLDRDAPENRRQVLWVIQGLGEQAEILEQEGKKDSCKIIEPLGQALVPVLHKLLRTEEWDGLKDEVLKALGALGPASAPVVADLQQLLENPDEEGMLHDSIVVETLGKIGPAASSAIPLLKHLLRDHDDVYKSGIRNALANIVPESERDDWLEPSCQGCILEMGDSWVTRGLYLNAGGILGLSTADPSDSDSAGFFGGGELSLSWLESPMGAFYGGYFDVGATKNDQLRISLGGELGFSALAIDLGYVASIVGEKTEHGFQYTGLVPMGVITFYVRHCVFVNIPDELEVGIMIKYPLQIYKPGLGWGWWPWGSD